MFTTNHTILKHFKELYYKRNQHLDLI